MSYVVIHMNDGKCGACFKYPLSSPSWRPSTSRFIFCDNCAQPYFGRADPMVQQFHESGSCPICYETKDLVYFTCQGTESIASTSKALVGHTFCSGCSQTLGLTQPSQSPEMTVPSSSIQCPICGRKVVSAILASPEILEIPDGAAVRTFTHAELDMREVSTASTQADLDRREVIRGHLQAPSDVPMTPGATQDSSEGRMVNNECRHEVGKIIKIALTKRCKRKVKIKWARKGGKEWINFQNLNDGPLKREANVMFEEKFGC